LNVYCEIAAAIKNCQNELSTVPGVAAIQEPGGHQIPIIQQSFHVTAFSSDRENGYPAFVVADDL
jgi:hypothetical protein